MGGLSMELFIETSAALFLEYNEIKKITINNINYVNVQKEEYSNQTMIMVLLFGGWTSQVAI